MPDPMDETLPYGPNLSRVPPVPQETVPSQAGLLRLAAILGPGLVMAWKGTSLAHMQPRQSWGLGVLVVAFVAVGLTCLVLLPRAAKTLLRRSDLLVPLGLYVSVSALLNALLAIPPLAALLAPALPIKFFSAGMSVSLSLVLQTLLSVVFAGWTTVLVVQAVREDRADAARAIVSIRQWFWPVLAAEAIGWGALCGVLAVVITVGFVFFPVALLTIGILSLIWNLWTAALLPVVVARRGPIGQAIREGLRTSWAGKGRWWLPVAAQMVLLGWVMFYYVSFTESPRPGATHSKTASNVVVNGFWTGGYENECRWHTKLMAAAETEPLPLAVFLLDVLFAVLAILVKLRITMDLYEQPPSVLQLEQPPQ